MVIAIDGPAGSGKSTTALLVAGKLGFIHINTGTMYRALSLKCINNNVEINDTAEIKKLLFNTTFQFSSNIEYELYMDNEKISDEIKSKKVTNFVSFISALPFVREKLVFFQRELAYGNDVVLEGRDIGTVVFPNADYKFYLVADILVRANRQFDELKAKGEKVTLKFVIDNINNRDRIDSTRKFSPLKKANDAIEIDTTNLNVEEQVDCIVKIINNI